MITFRHNFNLRYHDKIRVAPRYFILGDFYYFIHIDKKCEYAYIYYSFGAYKDNFYNIHFHSILKLYSNTKGIYFNFSYWINYNKKTTKRIYICD